MRGYPYVSVLHHDLLQEGEDLHTFCSHIYHYGISWTPSAMEQRIGRIDRVRSLSERRLTAVDRIPNEDHKLQVMFPHLLDTVEVVQVERVLERMNTFLRMMHEGLRTDVEGDGDRHVDLDEAFQQRRRRVPQIADPCTAFPVQENDLRGTVSAPAVKADEAQGLLDRFRQLPSLLGQHTGNLGMRPLLLGAGQVGHRVQPFTLVLIGMHGRTLVRCISPIGQVGTRKRVEEIAHLAANCPVKLGGPGPRGPHLRLTVEGEVLLSGAASIDQCRVDQLIERVLQQADHFERSLLPELDQKLDVFRVDLGRELGHD